MNQSSTTAEYYVLGVSGSHATHSKTPSRSITAASNEYSPYAAADTITNSTPGAALEEKTAETSHDEAGIIEAATLLPAAAGILFLSVLRYYGYLNVWESASTEILGIPTVSKCMRLEYYCNVYSTL